MRVQCESLHGDAAPPTTSAKKVRCADVVIAAVGASRIAVGASRFAQAAALAAASLAAASAAGLRHDKLTGYEYAANAMEPSHVVDL